MIPTPRETPASAEIARREEARLAADLFVVADTCEPILGGAMARSDPGSWTNHAVGLALDDRPIDDVEIDRLVRFYADHGVEPRVEVCPFTHGILLKGLASRGFVLHGFECLFARALSPDEHISPPAPPPAGLTIEPVDATDEAGLAAYSSAIYRTFFPPDHPGPSENDVLTMIRFLRKPGVTALRACIDGEFAGGGSVTVVGGVACITAAGVREPFRRRGIQQHLLARRIEFAARAGASLATIGSKPGAGTERNVMRLGFTLAYNRAVLVMPGEGLVPEPM